jgi:hypothetical protein
MTTQTEFYQQHAVDGVLSESQMAEMLMLPAEGDSALHVARAAGEPDPALDDDQGGSGKGAPASSKDGKDGTPPAGKTGAPTDAELTAANAVVLAKDGKHTIPFDRLEEAREKARTETERAAAAVAEAERLRLENDALKAAQAQAAATQSTTAPAAGPAAAADPAKLLEGVDFGDYSDGAIAKAVATLVDKRVSAAVAALGVKPGAAAEDPAVAATKAHYTAIYGAHPDADSIAESQELADWLGKQPKLVAQTYRDVLKGGATADVIEVFSAFKQATGTTGAGAGGNGGNPGAEALAAAERAIADAKARTPNSLSDLPAGSGAHHNERDAMLAKDSNQLMRQFEGKSPEEIMAALNRVL